MTAIGPVTDYLVALITALPECAPPVLVTDGWPGTFQAQQMVCVGGGPDTDDQSTMRDFVVMGNGPRNMQEEFAIQVYIRCWTGGTLQKPSRDQALTIFQAIEAKIRADLTLGGTVQTYPARIGQADLRQTTWENAQKGRVAEIRFTVDIKNRY
ncbi:MAG: hypothetical protein ACXV5Q_01365 [Frankiaceae bacterium]